MTRVSIFYCKKIKDTSCIACAKCFKGVSEKNGEFARHEGPVEIASMTDCGDCPGLVVPRVGLVMGVLKGLDREPDAIHIGSCVKKAVEVGGCQMDLDKVKAVIEKNTGKPVYIGTHNY